MTLEPAVSRNAFAFAGWCATAALVLSCNQGQVSEALVAKPFDAVKVSTSLELSATPAFADERGGGVFIDLAGRVVRVRQDGTRGLLESHPGNTVTPGRATAVWPLGPYSALVATDKGLFVAESGWLIAPPWQALLPPEGLVATAIADNGVGWLAHANGLFRLDGGELSELKINGASVTGLTAMGIAPAPNGGTGLWFAQGAKVSSAAQTSKFEFTVKDSGLTADQLKGGVIGMAGLGAAPGQLGELWAITPKSLFQFTPATGWRKYELGRAPKQVMSSGRVAWFQSGDGLFRYDADDQTWGEAKQLDTVPSLLAVDAAGTAWVRSGPSTLSVSPAPPVRIEGLFQNMEVYDPELVVQITFPSSAKVTSLNWSFDSGAGRAITLTDGQPGTGPQASLTFYSLGGVEPSGAAKTVSFAALEDGLHTLSVTALVDDLVATRLLHFNLHASATAVVSWAKDIQPIAEARCFKCHTTGTMPELGTYEEWKGQSQNILNAVRDRRMPADGPLDPAGIAAIQRWVNGGTQP